MRTIKLIAVVFAVVVLGSSSVFAQTAGMFQLPFDKDGQVWVPSCNEGVGYKIPPDQQHMEWNTILNKYHIGEDWNGICGKNSDLGAPLFAIADGIVDFVDNVGAGTRGKWLAVLYTLPDGKQIKSAYFHLNEILVNINDPVYKNNTVIAKIGNTGNSNTAHLHWSMLTDVGAPIIGYSLLSVVDALKYASPSLLVDDRGSGGVTIPLTNGVWTQFTVQILYTDFSRICARCSRCTIFNKESSGYWAY